MAGLTLVELMVAVALGLILTTGVINAFLASKQGSYQDEQIASVQENARFALYALKRDLSMASYTAAVSLDPATYTAELAKDCGADWATNLFTVVDQIDPVTGNVEKILSRNGIEFINNAPTATSEYCTDDDVQADTDVLVVRRGADDFTRRYGESINGRKATDERFYLADGGIFQGTDVTVDTKTTVMEYIAKSYYVRNFTAQAGDGEPCLMLNSLATTGGGMNQDCLVPGVEDLQISWGIDTSAEPDQTPNGFKDDPDATELTQVVAAQIHILVRSAGTVTGYTDTKTYTVGSHVLGPFNDGYYRRVFSTSVRIPNHYLAKPGLASGA